MYRLRSFVLATGLAASAASGTLSCTAQEPKWAGFDMPSATPGCFLEKNASDLEHDLWNFGWKAYGDNFPDIAWDKQMIAIVVPTLDEALRPTRVGISNGQVVVHLGPSDQDYDGVVVQIPKAYARLKKCRLRYPDRGTPDPVYSMIVVSAISMDSITADKLYDPSAPRAPTPPPPAPPPDENHDLPAAATLPGTEPPQ